MSEFQVVNGSSGRGAMHKTAALRYLDELFRYAMVLTRNQTDAEDLVQ
jgi:DNA-directed RNA polymerase specialized sigma24 family protein